MVQLHFYTVLPHIFLKNTVYANKKLIATVCGGLLNPGAQYLETLNVTSEKNPNKFYCTSQKNKGCQIGHNYGKSLNMRVIYYDLIIFGLCDTFSSGTH
jgi:hypothetical protein